MFQHFHDSHVFILKLFIQILEKLDVSIVFCIAFFDFHARNVAEVYYYHNQLITTSDVVRTIICSNPEHVVE